MTSAASLEWAKEHDRDYQATLKALNEPEKVQKEGNKGKGTTKGRVLGQRVKIIPGRRGFTCCYCEIEYGVDYDPLEDDRWVQCPACKRAAHAECIRACKQCLCDKKIIPVA